MTQAVLRQDLGVLRLTGKDSRDLLQRLSTNDVLKRRVGDVVDNVLTTEKGRVLDVVTMIFRDDALWLVTRGPPTVAGEHIDKMTFREDAKVAVAPWVVAHLIGGAATLPAMPRGFVVQGAVAGVNGLHVIGPAAAVETAISGIARMSDFEQFRVREGIAAYGKEISEAYNPHEARLGAFIDWEKGCYVGQEVVARLDTYKKVQRTLLRLRSDKTFAEGDAVLASGETVGSVTSAAGDAALAYVKLAAEDAPLTVGGAPVQVIPW
jgi:folate-binding protein YgfZ